MKKYFPYILLLMGILMFFAPQRIPQIDNKTEQFFNNSIKETLISYATVRGINAVVSIIKHSSIDAEPAGIGMTIGAGELVDPIDDLTERVSDVFFLALISMGVVKILYHFSLVFFNILFAFMFICLALYFLTEKNKKIFLNFSKFLLIIASIRVIFPLVAFSGYYVNNYFQTQINETTKELKIVSFEQNNAFQVPAFNGGVFDTLKTGFQFVKMKSAEIVDMFIKIKQNLNSIIDNLIQLAYLYVSMFLINIVIIPFIFYLFFKKLLENK